MAHNVLDTLALAVAANVRLMRSWHAETGLGDPTHPLLTPETPLHLRTMQVTQQEYQLVMAGRTNAA